MEILHFIILFIFAIFTWKQLDEAGEEKNWVKFWVGVIMVLLIILFGAIK